MGSPDGETPQGAINFLQLAGMADYTQEGIAQTKNTEMQAVADEARENFLNGILGGFLNVVSGIGAAINQFVSDLVFALKGITGGMIDLTGYFNDQADTLVTTTTTANAAYTLADSAHTVAEDAVSTAEDAANAAAVADTKADQAYAAAGYFEAECIVASAGVNLGVNELRIGLCQNVPTGMGRLITDLHIALLDDIGGLTLQTKKFNAAGTSSSVLHTATLGANVTRVSYNNMNLTVVDKERVFWNVSAAPGTIPPNVLQCLIFGVLI